MRRRVAAAEILDKHHIRCPRCACPEAIVLLNENFEVNWQCVDCEALWPASEEESCMLLSLGTSRVH